MFSWIGYIVLDQVKSHGNFGKVVQASDVAPSAHAKLEHGKRRKRSENLDFDFIPFNVYDDRRVKLLKVEENDFHALPRVIDASNKKKRADVEKQVEEVESASPSKNDKSEGILSAFKQIHN